MSNAQEKQTVRMARNAFAMTVLANINYVTFCSTKGCTYMKMNKYDKYWNVDVATGKKSKNPNAILNPYFEAGIKKFAYKYKIVTGFDYVNAVGDRREAEGKEREFQQGEAWFEQVSKALVIKKGEPEKMYFRYQYLQDSTVTREFTFNGQPIQKAAFQQFLLPPSDYKNQGLDKTLNFQVIALDNLQEITLNGIHYILE